MPVLVQELLALYAHGGDADGAAAGDALSRLSGLDRGAGSRRGDRGLAGRLWPGWKRPRRVAPHDPGRAPVAPEQITLALSETLTAALTLAGAPAGPDAQHLDPGGLGDSARPLTGRDDVVFGVTVAGRPPEIAGIESMVGLFINTLPLRVQAAAGKAAGDAACARCRTASRG